ncbi:porin family protein [Flavobacterium chuncheonense]|uniref:Porin family protein n=1 Tax=Flavobacterium chuncheonense TaxID=2026653 RepID=A0ABW5YK97_9FLAO
MRKFWLSIVAIFIVGFVTAQEINFGVKGGFNTSMLKGDVDNTSALSGFHAGAFAEIKILNTLAIQPELLYSTQGSKFDGSDDLKLDYFQVPVMGKFYFLNIVYVEGGPQVGFLTNAKLGDEDVKDSFTSTDVSLGLGAGINLLDKLRAGVRFNFGLSDISETSDDVKSFVFQVGGAYIF